MVRLYMNIDDVVAILPGFVLGRSKFGIEMVGFQ